MFYNLLTKEIFVAYNDASEPWQLGFQDPATAAVEGMIDFHNYIMVFFNCDWFFCYVDVVPSCSIL